MDPKEIVDIQEPPVVQDLKGRWDQLALQVTVALVHPDLKETEDHLAPTGTGVWERRETLEHQDTMVSS